MPSATHNNKIPGRTLGIGAFALTLGVVALSGLGPRVAATEKFLPHGYCYLWVPALMRLHIVADLLIGLAYIAIPVTLVRFMRKRTDLPFNWMFLLFGLFIVACGATHIVEVWTLWYPNYWLAGGVKAVTAAASIPTALMLYMLVPQAVALPSTRQLREAKEALEREVAERERAERALREAHASLERRVSERTAALQEANVLLEAQRRELEAADRKKNEFLAILSHELRNPVHAIHTSAEYLSIKTAEADSKETLGVIARQVDQLSQLLDDLLSVVKGEDQLNRLEQEQVDLREVVSMSAEAVAAATGNRRQRLRIQAPPDPIHVHGDARRLSQALVNLLRNASNYSEPGSDIDIEVCAHAGGAVIQVRDRGIGLDPAEAPRLFELFARGERARRQAATGLGIGLHVAQRIVQAHGGSIDAESPGLGQGTVFTITLPLEP